MNPFILGGVMAALAAAAPAANAASDTLGYTYVDAGYVGLDYDNADGDGWGLRASLALTDRLHLFGGYESGEIDPDGPFLGDLDYTGYSAGIGLNLPVATRTDLVGRIGYVYAEIEDFDDSGVGLYAGVRSRVADEFELEGGIDYVDLDEAGDDTAFSLGGRWYFAEAFALGAGVTQGDDATTWSLSLRWEMPAG